MGEISQSLTLPITRSKHAVSTKVPLQHEMEPISSTDQILVWALNRSSYIQGQDFLGTSHVA